MGPEVSQRYPGRAHHALNLVVRGLRTATILSAVALGSSLAWGAPSLPALTGRVVDEADLLSPSVEIRLQEQAANLERNTGAQLVVATLPTLHGRPIEDVGYQLGRTWELGREGVHDGVLLLVAPEERKVRVDVGYGLEGVLTDAWCDHMIRRVVVPLFRAGDFDQGVLDGMSAIVAHLEADAVSQEAALIDAVAAQSEPASAVDGTTVLQLLLLGLFLLWVVWAAPRARRYQGSVFLWEARRGGFGGGGGSGSFGGGGASGGW